MHVGQILPMVGPTVDTRSIDAVCTEAELVGLDSLWVVDHVAIPHPVTDTYPYLPHGEFPAAGVTWWEALAVLAYAAARTSTVRIGTALLVLPYRNAVVTAKALATIDALSGGRLTVGIGVGWMRQEFEVLGAPFEHRGRLADEQLEVMRTLWSAGLSSHDGDFHRFADIDVTPTPPRGRLPVLVGGTTDAALRRAARTGDGWIALGLTADELASRRRRLHELAAEAGRSEELPVYLQVAIVITEAPVDPAMLGESAAVLAGTPEQLADALVAYRDAGVEHLIANAGSLDSLFPTAEVAQHTLRVLATEIRPALA